MSIRPDPAVSRPRGTAQNSGRSPLQVVRNPVRTRLRRGLAHPSVVVIIAAAAGYGALGDTDLFSTLAMSGILAIAGVGLAMLTGLAGQLSLGHAAFLGVAAYTSAIATVEWGLPPLVGTAMAVGVAVLLALITSPILRLRGHYLALATLALGLGVQQLSVNLDGVTGGTDGYPGIPPYAIGGLTFSSQQENYVLAWTGLAIAVWVQHNLTTSRIGRALRAIEADELAARASAVPATRYRVAVWLLAAAFAGLAGSLFAHNLRFVSPESFSLLLSATLLAAVVVGGTTSILGPVVAIVLLRFVPDLPLGLSPALFTGLLLVVVMTVAPGGLAGAVRTVRSAVTRRGGSGS